MTDRMQVPTAATSRWFSPYPSYKNSGIEWLGRIPEHWNAQALKWVVEPTRPITYGIVQCGPDYPGGVPYIRPVDMSDERGVNVDNLRRTSPEIAADYSRSEIKPNDLIVSIGPSFGKIMITPKELNGANLTQGTARVAPSGAMSTKFLYWALRNNLLWQAWDSSCSGATFRALTLEILSYCSIAIPPLNDQILIASFLDRETARIDALIEKKEQLIELLQEKRTALITQAVTKGLDPTVPMKDSGIEWLGKIPMHWDVRPINSLYNVALGKMLDLKRVTGHHLAKYLRNQDVQWDRINVEDLPEMDFEADERARFILCPGDLLICEGGEPGRAAIWNGELEEYFFQKAIHRLRPLDAAQVPRFLFYLVFFVTELGVFDAGGNPNTISHLTAVQLRHYRLPFPSPFEQGLIVSFLDHATEKVDKLVAGIREAIAYLKEYRMALISAAVTGQIDVREACASAQEPY